MHAPPRNRDKSSKDSEWPSMWWDNNIWSHTHNPHATECTCQRTNAYTPGDSHRVQLENATTTTTVHPPVTLQPGDATRQAQSAGR